jgi:mannose-6-phosphate isomerase-like protein (cupin superfamily)
MAASAEQYGPVATRMLMENDDVRVWEMDLKPGEFCGLHHHTLDYVLYILEGAKVSVESPPGRKPSRFDVEARGTYYVPAGGIESARNVGDTRFREVLVELKRAAPPGRERLGFVGCEAVAGKQPEPGVITILDNDRVRVREVTLGAGDESGMRRQSRDAVMFVVEGGRVKLVERDENGSERIGELEQQANAVRWIRRGGFRNTINLGNRRYRELLVEIK